MFLPKLCYIVTYSRYIFNKIFCPCYLTLISKYGLYLIGWDRIWWDRALLQDTLRCALTIFFQHNFRLFFFFCNCFYLFKLFNPTKWVISKHPYKTHLWKRWGKEKKKIHLRCDISNISSSFCKLQSVHASSMKL